MLNIEQPNKKELAEKYNELKSIILKSKKFKVREDFHLFILLEEISTKIEELQNAKH